MKNAVIALLLLTFWLAGCDATPSATPLPEAGKGALTGQVSGAGAIWPGEPLCIFAAAYFGDPGGQGFYMLDPERDPHAALAKNGVFHLNNLEPGLYILVVGPAAETGRRVVDEAQQPYLVEVKADVVTGLGVISLEP